MGCHDRDERDTETEKLNQAKEDRIIQALRDWIQSGTTGEFTVKGTYFTRTSYTPDYAVYLNKPEFVLNIGRDRPDKEEE